MLVALSLPAGPFAPRRCKHGPNRRGRGGILGQLHVVSPSGRFGDSQYVSTAAGNPAATDPAYVADVISNGKSGPIEVAGVAYDSVMPPVAALDGAELDAVVAYVVSLAGGGAETPPNRRPDHASGTTDGRRSRQWA